MEATVCSRASRCSISHLLLWALGQVGYGLSADAADCAAVYCGYYEPDGPCVAEAMSRDSMEVQLVVGHDVAVCTDLDREPRLCWMRMVWVLRGRNITFFAPDLPASFKAMGSVTSSSALVSVHLPPTCFGDAERSLNLGGRTRVSIRWSPAWLFPLVIRRHLFI